MNDVDLAFLDIAFPEEHERIRFIYDRDGFDETYKWVQTTYNVYRAHIAFKTRNNTLSHSHRLVFIKSCLDFRRFLRIHRKTLLT